MKEMNLNVSTYPCSVKGRQYPKGTVLLQLHLYLHSSPKLEIDSECSQLQENVYFTGSILNIYQITTPSLYESLTWCCFYPKGILYVTPTAYVGG